MPSMYSIHGRLSECGLMGTFRTLEKFYVGLRAQNDLGTIKRFLRQPEISAQLDACERELKAASTVFITQYKVGIASALVEMNIDTERRHQELLELISAQSGTTAATASIREGSLNNSSGSLSLLPASPKIFHGRDAELNDLVCSLLTESPRVAVLGPGGIGKTTLATAALHHAAIFKRYNHRHFISCESADATVDLVSIIGLHLGLEPSRQLSKAIEVSESRGGVEEFLSSLADVPSLGLLITMRGAERPGKVKWTRPFLPPLEPLALSASRQIFAEVADGPEIGEESALEDLLDLSGGLPLATSLMASVAAFEGYTNTLSRWMLENTRLLSDGHDKRSNLDISISLSLGSPRISSSPETRNLLSLLSILPDGIMEEDLIICKVPLSNVPHSRALLIQTSLAYIDGGGRMKALSPIREYIKRVYPPPVSLSKPLRTYFQELFRIWDTRQELPSPDLVPKMVSCLGNINGLMLQGLIDDQAAMSDIGHSILTLNSFSRTMLKGSSSLTCHLPRVIEITGDSRLRWSYTCSYLTHSIPPIVMADAERLIAEGFEHFNTIQCHIEEDSFGDSARTLKLIHEARRSGGLELNGMESYRLFLIEAYAHISLGKLSRGLALCPKLNQLVATSGLEEADRYLGMLDVQAAIHLQKSEYTRAYNIHAVIESKTSRTHAPLLHANSLAALAYLDIIMSGNDVEIFRNLNRAKAEHRDLGIPGILMCSCVAGWLSLYHGDTNSARVTFEDCLLESRAIYYPALASLCLAALGDPRHKMYSPVVTLNWAFVYFSFVRKSKDRVATFHALRCLADIFAGSDDEETGLNLYHTVLDGATEMDIHRLRAESMIGIGDIMMRRGDSVRAKEMWNAARPLFIRSSQMKDVTVIDERLAQLHPDIGGTPPRGRMEGLSLF
ncbi:hypothetical protein FB451DRAFT_1460628 [Mycena latifolia]|nr:hypothetical protein FB451DRAFT_1460628 [Mycena latifolia]